MISGMNLFTFAHVAVSLIAIASGFVVVFGFLKAQRFPNWTAIFLITTALTSITGFFFPIERFTPALALGVISLIVLAAAIVARYRRGLTGRWRAVFVLSSIAAWYFNVFVLIAQLFLKVPALNALAPTQSEPPFLAAQTVCLALFVGLAIVSLIKFRSEQAQIM